MAIIEKDNLRLKMKGMRKNLSKEERELLSEKVFKNLIKMNEYQNAKTVCVYMDTFGEVRTSSIIEDLRRQGKEILFPVSDTKTNTLTLCRDTGDFIKGAYRILEPKEKITACFNTPDLIIVPGLAFDINKNRLGFGAGYYDRLLAVSRAYKIGICYDFQVVENVYCEAHDVMMDAVVSEKRIIV